MQPSLNAMALTHCDKAEKPHSFVRLPRCVKIVPFQDQPLLDIRGPQSVLTTPQPCPSGACVYDLFNISGASPGASKTCLYTLPHPTLQKGPSRAVWMESSRALPLSPRDLNFSVAIETQSSSRVPAHHLSSYSQPLVTIAVVNALRRTDHGILQKFKFN